jgi:hypothetical protein
VSRLEATAPGRTALRLTLPASWTAASAGGGAASVADPRAVPTRPEVTSTGPLTLAYGTGYVPHQQAGPTGPGGSVSVRLQAAQPARPEVTAVATDGFLTAAGARPGQRVDVVFAGQNVPVRIAAAVRALPTTAHGAAPGDSVDAAHDGGGLLLDLRSVNRLLETRYGVGVAPTEWWLSTDAHHAADVATALRALPDVDPAQVVVRDEIAAGLRDDPFGAGPAAAFTAAAVVAALLAALGFAVNATGALRERDAEFAVLRALGAPRRRLARMLAAEQGVLVAVALAAGAALGTVLARAVIPLIVLTGQATKPVPTVLVDLPLTRVAVLLAAVAAGPLLVTAALTLRRAEPAVSLRDRGGE